MTVPEAPCAIDVRVPCPSCGRVTQTVIGLTPKLVTETLADGGKSSALDLAVTKKKLEHDCHQTTMDERLVDTDTGEVLS